MLGRVGVVHRFLARCICRSLLRGDHRVALSLRHRILGHRLILARTGRGIDTLRGGTGEEKIAPTPDYSNGGTDPSTLPYGPFEQDQFGNPVNGSLLRRTF